MSYEGLRAFLLHFQKESGNYVVIKDFVGLLEMDSELFSAVHDFYIHKQSYCMYIKENQRLWNYCLLEKRMIYNRLLRDPKPFIGNCYAGIREYVIPIIYNKLIIGALTVGNLRIDAPIIDKKLSNLAKRNQLNLDKLHYTYLESTITEDPKFEVIVQPLKIIAEYISLTYGNLIERDRAKIRDYHEISRPYILSHIMEYLNLHHKEEVTLDELALFCHCSKSYISHQFKKFTQMTLKTYINQLRVNTAKKLLKEGKSITETAYLVGFKDSNYFSMVFKQLDGVTPTEYLRLVVRSGNHMP